MLFRSNSLHANADTESLPQAVASSSTLFASAACGAADQTADPGAWMQSSEWVLAPAHANGLGANVEIASQPSAWTIPVAAASGGVVESANRPAHSKSTSPAAERSKASESKADESQTVGLNQSGVDRESHSATQRRVTLGKIGRAHV